LAATGSAGAQEPAPVEVRAQGNPFYDSANLRFSPAAVTAAVGQTVRWTNTDTTVPHTATEDHDLWDLGGSYGATPANPPGMAPGTSVGRRFEAGVHRYHCRIHASMNGVVSVPVLLATARRRVTRLVRVPVRIPGTRRTAVFRIRVGRTVTDVAMRWAPLPSGPDRVFDVEVRRGEGPYKRYATGTHRSSGMLIGQNPGTTFGVRARMRAKGGESRATDWSAAATIVS
ncbi:MAG TPA: plastocyanin/azurin family copper-binding protein, partial [Solirubrobacteraceae bacterium]|nr:plastocyanin/azurin family copper-binding protein [Solirubrobacteraceae bacterium]